MHQQAQGPTRMGASRGMVDTALVHRGVHRGVRQGVPGKEIGA